MATSSPRAALRELGVSVTQMLYPPYHERHGTNYPVVERLFAFHLPEGTAEVDQTDYGHPGRFNPFHARHVPAALQSKTGQLVAAAAALATLLE